MKNTDQEIRLDTYLWAIRIFKSRTLAGNAVRTGKAKLNELKIKPAHKIKEGEIYIISFAGGIKKIIEVVSLTDKRRSFEIAKKHYKDLSQPIEKISKEEKAFFTTNIKHEKGSGRPSKKNRRDLKKHGGWF